MDVLCTTCCRQKRDDPGLLPARERYLSARIRFADAESRRRDLPLRILSGRFGLLAPETLIPRYDHALQPADVPRLLPLVARQLAELGAQRLVLYAEPRHHAGWEPYYQLLEEACKLGDVALEVRLVAPELEAETAS